MWITGVRTYLTRPVLRESINPACREFLNFQIAGVTSIGQQLLQPVIDGHWQLSDNLSWVTGTHSLKFGVEYINWFVNRYLPVTPTRFGISFSMGHTAAMRTPTSCWDCR